MIVASAFAADGDDGKSKRRGGNGQRNTGTFQIVIPKADRNGSGRKVAKILTPESDLTGSGPITAQFVPPKADPGNSSGPTKLFSVSPKEPRAGDGPVTVKLVTPKAPRGDGPVLAKVSSLRQRPPQPPSMSSRAPLLAPVETKAQPAVVASESPAPVPAASEADERQVELAYIVPPSVTATMIVPATMKAMMTPIPEAPTETMAAIEYANAAHTLRPWGFVPGAFGL